MIREKTPADTAHLLEVLARVQAGDGYPLAVQPDGLHGFLESPHERAAWVAETDGAIAGHVALHCPPRDPTRSVAAAATGLPVDRLALVSRLFVAPEQRRTGLGRLLLRHATAHAPALGRRAVLDVGQRLRTAIALYESEGWSRVGELHLPLDAPYAKVMLDLWVYVSPTAD